MKYFVVSFLACCVLLTIASNYTRESCCKKPCVDECYCCCVATQCSNCKLCSNCVCES